MADNNDFAMGYAMGNDNSKGNNGGWGYGAGGMWGEWIFAIIILAMFAGGDDQWRVAGRMTMPADHMDKLTEPVAKEWLESMENSDGTTGPHWTLEQTKQVAAQKGVTYDPVKFWVAMNMMYSDYFSVAKKFNINNTDFYVELAKAFLDDKDAAPGKLARYYEFVVR